VGRKEASEALAAFTVELAVGLCAHLRTLDLPKIDVIEPREFDDIQKRDKN